MGELKLNVADGEEDLKELEANQEGLASAFDLGGGQGEYGHDVPHRRCNAMVAEEVW